MAETDRLTGDWGFCDVWGCDAPAEWGIEGGTYLCAAHKSMGDHR